MADKGQLMTRNQLLQNCALDPITTPHEVVDMRRMNECISGAAVGLARKLLFKSNNTNNDRIAGRSGPIVPQPAGP